MPKCHVCAERKPQAEFYKDRSRTSGCASRCKPCTNQYCKKYQRDHWSPDRWRWKTYGLSQEDFEGMLWVQDNACLVCEQQLVDPCVDHDHETGKVRGILCRTCNVGLGAFHDDVGVLSTAINYLNGSP